MWLFIKLIVPLFHNRVDKTMSVTRRLKNIIQNNNTFITSSDLVHLLLKEVMCRIIHNFESSIVSPMIGICVEDLNIFFVVDKNERT